MGEATTGTYGEQLRAAMAAAGMSGADLARRCRVSRMAVSLWTLDRCLPGPLHAATVAHLLGVGIPEPRRLGRPPSVESCGFADDLADELARRGVSVTWVAREVGVVRQAVANWLWARALPTPEAADALRRVLPGLASVPSRRAGRPSAYTSGPQGRRVAPRPSTAGSPAEPLEGAAAGPG